MKPTYIFEMDYKVVLVDDDAVVLFLHKVLVKRSCLPPVAFSCKNAREALEEMKGSGVENTPYLVLLDINMPIMNGWEFLDAIQSEKFKDHIYVVIATSSINSHDHRKAEEYPQFIDYLEKPLSVEVLNSVCDKIESLICREI
ncbi:response regulator [Salinimicrobium marinum]|uniref:Response regulator n=1 Tax=Salinimicrobium marinum TaxID=680283 RepID=A0A918VYQ1_9FLAO|nr:response regulator [Salinimicrobium marinum]GHA43080.1 response regulator [Salinimicrobium marinum]